MNKKWLKMLSIMLCLVFVFSIPTYAAEERSESANELKSDMNSMIQDIIANVKTKNDAQQQIDAMNSQYASMYSEEDINAYFNYMLQYVELKEKLGEYVEEKDFTYVEEKNGTISSAVLTLKFKNCDVEFSFAIEDGAALPTFNFERVATFGEKMQKAALNTLMGMGTVFAVLIFISLLIGCFSFFGKSESKKEQPQAAAAAPQAPVLDEVEEDVTDDSELVAVISAAIAAAEGSFAQGFQVRSIKRVKKSRW